MRSQLTINRVIVNFKQNLVDIHKEECYEIDGRKFRRILISLIHCQIKQDLTLYYIAWAYLMPMGYVNLYRTSYIGHVKKLGISLLRYLEFHNRRFFSNLYWYVNFESYSVLLNGSIIFFFSTESNIYRFKCFVVMKCGRI